MKHLAIFALLVGLAVCAPTSKESNEITQNDKLLINKGFFPDEFKIHTSEHDIVNILVPLNALNFDDDDDEEDNSINDGNEDTTLFFVEADIKNGIKEYKGLYVKRNKQVKKLLDTGTDAAAANDGTKTAYFSATDGLYIYNEKENTAEKYGSVTDNILSLAKVNGSDLIYILTANHELYKVTDGGTQKVKVNDVVGAQQIVLDYTNNLYYYGADKQPYVMSENGIKKIEGLPTAVTYINLVKPPFIIENGIPVIINDKAYIIYVNGTSELTDFEFTVTPTAYALEATLIQYYAYDKSIYEYNMLAIILSGLLNELKDFLNDKTDEIQSIATRSRSGFVP